MLSAKRRLSSLPQWPECDEKLLVEDSFKYPVSFNGKTRFTIELPREASQDEIREAVLSADEAQKWLEGKTPKKVINRPRPHHQHRIIVITIA